jgi:hypothetical protein
MVRYGYAFKDGTFAGAMNLREAIRWSKAVWLTTGEVCIVRSNGREWVRFT